jgi:UDP-3-O-[3-hydroxymyristoyl] glucosamine N-acyltransferase
MNYRLRRIEPTGAATLFTRSGLTAHELIGNRDLLISGDSYFDQLSAARPGSISYAYVAPRRDPQEIARKVDAGAASVVILEPALKALVEVRDNRLLIVTDNAQLTFIKFFNACAEEYRPEFLAPEEFPTSGFFAPNTLIERGATIGEQVRIFGNVYIAGGTRIGNNVIISPGAVIGGEGYGFVKDTDGSLINFPHVGGVIIEDDVFVGSCVCIDKGNFGDTILQRGCKIDNLVHIAHNVNVGRHAMVIANAMVAGACVVGDGARIAPSTSILNGVSVGAGAFIGLHSCVVRDIPDGVLAYGVPAKVAGERGNKG